MRLAAREGFCFGSTVQFHDEETAGRDAAVINQGRFRPDQDIPPVVEVFPVRLRLLLSARGGIGVVLGEDCLGY